MENARKICFDALLKTLEDNSYSNIVMTSLMKKHYEEPRNRAFVCALYYGVIEREITLDYIISKFSKTKLNKIEKKVLVLLRMGVYQIIYMDKIPDSAAVNETVSLCKKAGVYSARGFVNGILRNVSREKDEIGYPPEGTDEFLSVYYSCNIGKVKLIREAYGYEICESYLKSSFGAPPLTVRTNTLKCDSNELISLLDKENITAEPFSGVENAVNITSGAEILFSSQAYKSGLFHVEDAASQICCTALGANEGDTVIDVCAAPGGKTATIAENMNNKGKIIACDIHNHKLKLIEQTAQRLGIDTITATLRDASSGNNLQGIKADRVLCDVPCSGFGIFRRKPELKTKPLEDLSSLYKLQYDILSKSAELVKKGGTLIYSTCTLNPKENIENVERFLKEHPGFRPQKLNLTKDIKRIIQNEPEYAVTLFPMSNNTDGFFISSFVKEE